MNRFDEMETLQWSRGDTEHSAHQPTYKSSETQH